MYLGRVVESARTEALFDNPQHPYTRALLAEVPRLDQRKRDFTPIAGEIPSPLNPPSGCHFHPRCPHVMSVCKADIPKLVQRHDLREVSCHLEDTGQPGQ
ncbi:MAG: oligopeptide/dipeptide ABC transporter ATP-binding protein [Granulosicoccus sp.]